MPERKRVHKNKTDDLAVELANTDAASPIAAPLRVPVPTGQSTTSPSVADAPHGPGPIDQLRHLHIRRLATGAKPDKPARQSPEVKANVMHAGQKPEKPAHWNAEKKLTKMFDGLSDEHRQKYAVELAEEIKVEVKATGGGARVETEDSKKYATSLYILASREAKEVIDLVRNICASVEGAKQEGAEYALKGLAGLAGKIGEELKVLTEKGLTAQEAAQNIDVAALVGDALRFTIVFPFDGFTDNVLNAMGKLEAAKYKSLKIGNTFLKAGATYRGINTNWRKMDEEGKFDGVKWELQFHTADSFDVKQHTNHASYEGARALPDQTDRRVGLLDKHMAKVSGAIPTPEGLEMVGIQRPRSKGQAPPLPEGINKIKEK